MLLKSVDRLALKLKRRGIDPNLHGQRNFCEAITQDKVDIREWMKKLVISRLARGDFSDWTGWECRNEWAIGSYSNEVPTPRWRLEPCESLAILGEQGIGDEIMFGSVIPEAMLRCKRVVFECDPRLIGVFTRSLGIECRPRADIIGRGQATIRYLTAKRDEQFFLPVGDLPRLFRKSRLDFPGKPFLKPSPGMIEKWNHLKGRTGLAWRSRTGQFKPQAMMSLGIKDPVVLQYDHWPYETEGMTVPDCDLRDSIEDVMGICANLEKIVSVPQTICHIAGSIGAKVDVILPPMGSSRVKDAFRYRYIQPMPWYGSMKVFQSLAAWKHA